MNKQPNIEYGMVDMNGNVWNDAQIDAYNRYTRDINEATYKPTREFLLDQRHRYFVAVMQEATQRKRKQVKHS